MRVVIIAPTISAGLHTYLETGNGSTLFSYFAKHRIWVSINPLNDTQIREAASVGGSHIVIPLGRVSNSLA